MSVGTANSFGLILHKLPVRPPTLTAGLVLVFVPMGDTSARQPTKPFLREMRERMRFTCTERAVLVMPGMLSITNLIDETFARVL